MDEPEAAIIFCNTKDDSFQVANFLKGQGFNADVLNGDLPQNERQIVMGRMKSGDLRFLVATDIAARGIDISFLPCVINYVLPESAESYVHRTGRTGRAGRSGVAVSLISPKEIGMFYQLRRAYKFELQRRDMVDDETLLALRERRALDRILAGLDAEEDLAYGQYLSFADSFPNLPDHRQRLAKLIAYFTAEEARKAAARAAAAPAKSRAEAKVEVATDAEPVTSRDAESAEVDAEEREPSPAYEAEEREPAGEREARGDDDRDGDDEGRDRGGRGRRRRGRGRGRDRDREGGAAEREPSEGEEREERGDREEAPRAETRPATADEAPRASGEPERKRRRSRNRGEGGAAMTGESEAISANGAPTSATGP
jgi:ATP-dependent RNA helicase DeaD